jgi:hypothetical protein
MTCAYACALKHDLQPLICVVALSCFGSLQTTIASQAQGERCASSFSRLPLTPLQLSIYFGDPFEGLRSCKLDVASVVSSESSTATDSCNVNLTDVVLQRGEIFEYKCESAASDFELAGLVTAGQGSVRAFVSAERYVGGDELITTASSQRIAADLEFPITAAVTGANNSSSLYAYVSCGGQPDDKAQYLASTAEPTTASSSTATAAAAATSADNSDECIFSLQMAKSAPTQAKSPPTVKPPVGNRQS